VAVTVLTDLRQYTQNGNVAYSVPTLDQMNAANVWADKDLIMYIPGYQFYETHVNADPFAAIMADSNRLGPVFQSIKRISQHICAPVLNPNLRIESKAPLNHDTRHLPPELRDFRLQLQEIDWSRLRSNRVSINELTLYEFKGGVQVPGAQQNILYLPEFRETKRSVSQGTFDITVFSELGCPSYFAFFCRNETTDILQQPLIKTLSIINETTKKKSNTVTDMTIGQMYHLTQRNVHPAAEYGRDAFNRRQTILLSAEDVGLLGLTSRRSGSSTDSAAPRTAAETCTSCLCTTTAGSTSTGAVCRSSRYMNKKKALI
jgi:hypothetical protein